MYGRSLPQCCTFLKLDLARKIRRTNPLAYFIPQTVTTKKVFMKSTPVPDIIKLFTVVIYKISQECLVFVPCKHFQPILLFVASQVVYS
jgi:hypothetical protein